MRHFTIRLRMLGAINRCAGILLGMLGSAGMFGCCASTA